MILECDDKVLLLVEVDLVMKGKSETIMVNDGADCHMMIKIQLVGPDQFSLVITQSIMVEKKVSITTQAIQFWLCQVAPLCKNCIIVSRKVKNAFSSNSLLI